jgi:hypothetical protein
MPQARLELRAVHCEPRSGERVPVLRLQDLRGGGEHVDAKKAHTHQISMERLWNLIRREKGEGTKRVPLRDVILHGRSERRCEAGRVLSQGH